MNLYNDLNIYTHLGANIFTRLFSNTERVHGITIRSGDLGAIYVDRYSDSLFICSRLRYYTEIHTARTRFPKQ